MRVLEKKNFWLIFVVILAAILRFLCIDKTGGLWYDELVSFDEASKNSILGVIFYTLKTDVHLPLYPVLLHYWGKLFSFSDISLRLFSAICGILTVLTSYFVGKEIKSKQTGLICAGIFAINSFMIFYSQEVRMYSLLMLFSTLNLLFLIRIKNDETNKWNYLGFILSAAAVISTKTLGFIFIFGQFLSLIIYALITKERRTLLKNILISSLITLALCSPIFLYLFFNLGYYTNQINGYYCDWSSLFIIVQNWFSPVLEGLYNNPINYIMTFLIVIDIHKIVFIFIPVAIGLGGLVYALKKDNFSWAIVGGALFFLLAEIIAFQTTNFKILSRYTAICFPNILILSAYGLSIIKPVKLKISLLSIFLIINLSYLIFDSNSAFKLPRNGFKPLANLLMLSGIKDNDFVLLWNRQEILNKYIYKKLNTLSLLKNFAYTSEKILGHENELNKLSLDQRKAKLKWYFASTNTPQNTIYIMKAIYDYAKPGQKFIVTTTKDFDLYTQESFTDLVKNTEKYKKTSFNDLLTIKSLINVKKQGYKKFRFIKRIEDKQYVVIIFEK